MRSFLSACAAILLVGTAALAQIDRAVLEGSITDPTGRLITAASVKVIAVDTGLAQEQTTNANGYYRFPGLAVGHYQVSVLSSGFKTKLLKM
jgi:protocatechuate 3,4-dioxygenase beta subunit